MCLEHLKFKRVDNSKNNPHSRTILCFTQIIVQNNYSLSLNILLNRAIFLIEK